MRERELADYLKGNIAFQPLMAELKIMWVKYNGWRRELVISDADHALREAVSDLLGVPLWDSRNIRISRKQWDKGLLTTRFGDVDMKAVLEFYFDQPIVSQKEAEMNRQREQDALFEKLVLEFAESPAGNWLMSLRQKPAAYGKIKMFLNLENDVLRKVCQAFNQLPSRKKETALLAVFANQICQNPHFFDEGPARSLLLQAIRWENSNLSDLTEEELLDINNVLQVAGLIRDGVSNRCLVYYLYAVCREKIHHGWSGFIKAQEPLCVTLRNVMEVELVRTQKQTILIENPSVFEILAETLRQQNRQDISLICTEGQPNRCFWELINKIDKERTVFWYCGDFDPEGIQMAQQMLNKIPDLKLWHYEVTDYYVAISNKKFGERRRKILEHCKEQSLQVLCQSILKEGRCGYQEALIPVYQKLDFN